MYSSSGFVYSDPLARNEEVSSIYTRDRLLDSRLWSLGCSELSDCVLLGGRLKSTMLDMRLFVLIPSRPSLGLFGARSKLWILV